MAVAMSYTQLIQPNIAAVRYVEVVEHHLHRIIRSLLPKIEFDEAWYLGRYTDVAGAVRDGQFRSGFAHYAAVGYFENRLPREVLVDSGWYLAAYPDVAEAMRRQRFKDAQDHFDREGFREGRLPYADWKL